MLTPCLINRFARPVERSAEHVFGNRTAQNVPGELDRRVLHVQTVRPFEYLQ